MDLKAWAARWESLAGKGEEEIGKSEKEGVKGEKKGREKCATIFII